MLRRDLLFKMLFVLFYSVGALTLEACTQSAPSTPSSAQSAPSSKIDQEITITPDGDNLYWATKTLAVKAGSTVKLTLKNTSSASGGMAHNWTLVKPGTEAQVANDGMQAGEDKNWISESPSIIAHTVLVKPGAEASITFVAPPAGEYPYICTYPGHATSMKGTLSSK
jgi:azurin